MAQYIVTASKLNKRSIVPANLPDDSHIVGVVFKDYKFTGTEADPAEVPNAALGKWYKDGDGFFYWGGALTEIPPPPVPVVVPANPSTAQLTAQQVQGATGARLVVAQKFLPYLIETCTRYKIDTPARQLCFLAQVGHESAALFYTEELASGRAYEGRKDLGNTHEDDGVKYKGRGLIQITGRGNYQWLTKDFKVDFITNPTWLGGKNASVCTADQLKYATLSAGWYWNNHALNAIADLVNLSLPIDDGTNLDHFKLITKKINGGYNGLSDRVARAVSGAPLFV